VPILWRWSLILLIVCLLASLVIGGYKLATTPIEVFTPSSDAWGTLQWPGTKS
jgi:hypothetical protein